jgi:hypothetical protein
MTLNSIDIVSFDPKLPTPKLLLYFWMKFQNLFGSDALDSLDNLPRTHRWYTLYQKVNMVFICPYFYELNFKPLRYFKTDAFKRQVNRFTEYNPAVFGRAYKMVQEY